MGPTWSQVLIVIVAVVNWTLIRLSGLKFNEFLLQLSSSKSSPPLSSSKSTVRRQLLDRSFPRRPIVPRVGSGRNLQTVRSHLRIVSSNYYWWYLRQVTIVTLRFAKNNTHDATNQVTYLHIFVKLSKHDATIHYYMTLDIIMTSPICQNQML